MGGSGEPLLTFLTAGNLPFIEFPFLSPLLEATGLWPRCPVQAQDDSEIKGHLLVSRVWLWKALSTFGPQLKASPAPRGRAAVLRLWPAPHCLRDCGRVPFLRAPTLSPCHEDPPLPAQSHRAALRSMRCLWTLAF